MEDDFKDYEEYYFLRQYPDAPDQAELAQSMEAMQTTEPSESMDGMQLAAGPSPDKINMAMQNMPLETSSETVRKSVDGIKTFVKWESEMPASVASITQGTEGPYTHDEILAILSTEEWTQYTLEP